MAHRVAECVCAADPLWMDAVWSLLGFFVGLAVGFVTRGKRHRGT